MEGSAVVVALDRVYKEQAEAHARRGAWVCVACGGYVRQVAILATRQLRAGISCHSGNLAYLLIYLNCVSGLVVFIQVHLLANTINFISGKVAEIAPHIYAP
jgi:hypothetical protein